jgi:serine/threonine protein kinase
MRWYILLVNIIGCTLTSIYFILWIKRSAYHQEKAYAGDAKSARRIILPFYKPLIKALVIAYVFLAISLILMYSSSTISTHRVVEYYGYISLSLYSLVPFMLLQTSASVKALWKTFFQIFPWFTISSLVWALSFINNDVGFSFSIAFVIISVSVPLILSLGILTKSIYSRVQVGSSSNRNCTELLLAYSIVYGVYLAISSVAQTYYFAVDVYLTVALFCSNQIFPFAMYRTLIADTKYWRGLGKHNQGGIELDDTLRSSGIDVHRPTMEMNIISSSFQSMMADINEITIDFAFLQLERLIGQGATSKVFCGRLKGKLAAVKLSTPPEITEEVIDVFVGEAKIAASLKHKNIVEFLGICVRPPQIGMVFEFCEGGNLKSNLTKSPHRWTPFLRLQACLDASNAIRCLHKNNYIHRDIKAENFFVGRKMVVKLGDFGETTQVRNKESTKNRRMTILGTVAFMAPELVTAERHYTQSIDIYALGVTFWEIWTGKDPYDDCSQFDIYERVKSGKQLPLPTDSPSGFNDILSATWRPKAEERPNADELVAMMENVISEFKQANEKDRVSTDGEVSGENNTMAVETVNPILASMRKSENREERVD